MVFKRPAPLDLAPQPTFKFWKKRPSHPPPPPKSPTFALSSSPLHPAYSAGSPPATPTTRPAGPAPSSPAAAPQGILLRRPTPLGPSTSAASNASPPSSSSSSHAVAAPTCPLPTPPPSSALPSPPPTPRRKSSSSESLANRRSGAVFPSDLLASDSFRSLVLDLPPSPSRPTHPLGGAGGAGEPVRRASEGTMMAGAAVVSTRRTGNPTAFGPSAGIPQVGTPSSSRAPAWAAGPDPNDAEPKRFGHGRKRSNSMSNIPLYDSQPSPLAPVHSRMAQDDQTLAYALPSTPAAASTRSSASSRPAPARALRTVSLGQTQPQHSYHPSQHLAFYQQQQQQPPTRTPFAVRSSRPAAPAVGSRTPSGAVAAAASSSSVRTSPSPPVPSSQHMSGFPSFVQPKLSSFRTLDRLHSPSPPPPTSPAPPVPSLPPTLSTQKREASPALPEVWVIPATPDLALADEEDDEEDGSAGTEDEDDDERRSLADVGAELGLPTIPTLVSADADPAARPIALDFGFDFGASLRFGSQDSLSAILSSASASVTTAGAVEVEVEVEDADEGAPVDAAAAVQPLARDEPAVEEQAPTPMVADEPAQIEDEQTTPTLASVNLASLPASPTVDGPVLPSTADAAAAVAADADALDTELARLIEALSSAGPSASPSTACLAALLQTSSLEQPQPAQTLTPGPPRTPSMLSPASAPAGGPRSAGSSPGSSASSPLQASSLVDFPAPPTTAASSPPPPPPPAPPAPAKRCSTSPTPAQHAHSLSAPTSLQGLGLGLALDPTASLLLQRRLAAHDAAASAASTSASSSSSTAALVRDHRRPFYVASASTPALTLRPRGALASSTPIAAAPMTPPPTASNARWAPAPPGQGSPSDCFLPRGETMDDLVRLVSDRSDRPLSPLSACSEDADDDESPALAYGRGSSPAFSTRSTTLPSLSSVQSDLSASSADDAPPAAAAAAAVAAPRSARRTASGKRSARSTAGSLASCSSSAFDVSDDGDEEEEEEEGNVEIARVAETALPVRWAFASATTPTMPTAVGAGKPVKPTRALPRPCASDAEDDDDEAYAGMAL